MIFDVPCFLSGLIICLSSLPTIQITSISRPPPSSSSAIAAAAAAVVGITLKFHQKHVPKKHKKKHIMKISHINVNIYDKAATSQQNSV